MKISPRTLLAAGVALIVVTNAVALVGVAYNRSGAPDSTLSLSERELEVPYSGSAGRENSGLSLRLVWSVLPAPSGKGQTGPEYGGPPAWLDAAKMAALGFDMRRPARRGSAEERSDGWHELPRDVLVVLELDGPANREAAARAELAAQEIEAADENGRGAADAARRRKLARENSRLFAVDAGIGADVLRLAYPDRSRYAIVHGQIRRGWTVDAADRPQGVITALTVSSVNVPIQWRGVFDAVATQIRETDSTRSSPYAVTLAFGRRLEPWIASAARN